MTQPTPFKKVKFWLLAAFGCFWAVLTGIFFALPSLPVTVGASGIAIALAFSGSVCLWGKRAIWPAIGLTAAAIVAYILATKTNFSVVNYAVLMAVGTNFLVFGSLGTSLRAAMPWWKSWAVLAGTFGGSLGLGWLLGIATG